MDIDGPVPEDMIVIAKGSATGALSVAKQAGAQATLPALRERQFSVTFTSDTHYQILDVATNTLVAERDFDPLSGIHYRGIQMSFSRRPAKGDTYLIDNNRDGIGDNGHINEIGNLGNQARIAQEALKIVHDQAVEARDNVSGVSLDQEAADLIRFQQAYQASARIIQTANQLFDAVIQVR